VGPANSRDCLSYHDSPLLRFRSGMSLVFREMWDTTEIRRCTHTGRPLGSAEFVQALEETMKRRLAPQTGGRPPKAGLDARQSELAFESE
jgi:hypothetical protein